MRKILASIFILMLLTPAMVWLIGLELDIHVERMGLKPPRLNRQALLDNEYYLSFDQYFNDSFSLRSPLIFAKRWLDYRLFHMTDTNDVHVGTNGWLYSRLSIEDYRKEACHDSAVIEQLVLDLHAVERMIEASGRQFIFTVAPNKATIYPEYLGFVPSAESCNHSNYELLLKTFKSYPLKRFVRLEKQLQNAKRNHTLLYNPTSTYWNERGARVAAKAIQAQIIQDPALEQLVGPTQGDPIDQGNLVRRVMGLLTEVEDEAVTRLMSSGFPTGSNAIVYGDGYLKNLSPYLSQMTERLEVIQTDSVPSRQHGEDLHTADIILLVNAASGLGMIRLDVDKIFTTFEAGTLPPLRYPIDLQAFVPKENIALNNQAAGLEIKSVGDQSRFAILSIPGSDSEVFRVLKLTVEAPHSDIMTVKFMTHTPLAISKALRPGTTALYVPLPFQTELSLSINPGNKAGVLLLQSAEILAFADLRETTEPRRLKNVLVKWLSDKNFALASPDTETIATAANPDPNSPEPTAGSLNSGEKSQANEPVSDLKAAFDAVFADKKIQPKKADPGTPVAKSANIAAKNEIGNSKDGVAKKIQPEKTEPGTPAAKSANTAQKSAIGSPKDGGDNKKNQTQAASIVPAQSTASPSINLTEFEEGRIFQRKGNSARVVISGTYSGQMNAIEARVVRSEPLTEIVPWTVIDPSPQNGIFVGQLAAVPQGGWYRIQVRSHSDHTVTDSGKNEWGVGMLVACLGQSNMKEWFYTGTDLKPHPLLRKYADNGWSMPGNQGNAAIAFGNRIIDRLGIPVGLLDYSENGSGLRKEANWGTGYWENTAPESIYNRFISGVSETGGTVEFVVWIQGEADAARGTVTAEEYAATLERFITNQVRTDITNGSDFEDLPFLVVMMIKRPGGKNKPHQAIRNAQKHVAEKVTNSYLAATTLDLKNHGRQHLTPKSYITLGRRVSQSILHLLGVETYHRGPKVSDVSRIDNRTIEIRIQHNAGSDFTPLSGITGWEVFTKGARVPITQVYRHDPQTIRIHLERPLDDKAEIRYLYGAMPDVKHPVLDNSPMSLPLEEYQAEIN